jgi:hypothetical protein
MKHIVRLLFVIALLTMVVGTAFAGPEDPPAPTVSWGEFILGDPMAITGFGYAPGLHLNIGLYRPDTVGGYAWIWAPPAGRTATYYEVPPSIETRRQAEVYALDNGSWATVFMLPRDEAWYPCSFPLKWKCPGTMPMSTATGTPWTTRRPTSCTRSGWSSMRMIGPTPRASS